VLLVAGLANPAFLVEVSAIAAVDASASLHAEGA